jgi:S1-C subfamily serine protease
MAGTRHVKRGLFGVGGHIVVYHCRNCAARLKSPLDEAGTTDTCPACGAQFIVPGADERDRLRDEKLAKKEAKRALAEAKRQAKEKETSNDDVQLSESDTSPAPLNGKRRHKRLIAAIAAASLAILALVGLAFHLGRQSAITAVADHDSIAPPTRVAPAALSGDVSDLPVVDANLPKRPTTGPSETLAMTDKPGAIPVDHSTQKLISEAEKSVAFIDVDGYTNESDGAGSGFLIGRNMLVTNYHVIEGGKAIKVKFPDGHNVDAIGWLAFDREKDLALIACDSDDLQPLKLAAIRPKKLDVVFAVGSPLGLSGTISNGIVSGIRSHQELGKDVVLIQSTAAISPGNSGGPLLNEGGEVVGVTKMMLEGGQSLNFAVAAEHVSHLLATAKKETQPWYKLPLPALQSVTKPNDGEERERRIANERAKITAEAFVAAVKEAQEKHDQTQAVQAELDRIVSRAGDITNALSVIEAEGTALTQRRALLIARSVGDFADGQNTQLQLGQLRSQLQYYQIKLHRAIKYALYDQVGVLQAQTAQLEAQVLSLDQKLSVLRSNLLSCDQEASNLASQISYKAAQRNQLVAELTLLRQRYDEIQAQSVDANALIQP